jgi:AraC-like DNA-binding protein
MEPTAFSRFFHAHIGLRFSDFLHAYRVSLALREMRSHDAPVKVIAGRTGYGSVATFVRSVKRLTGTCPSALRRRLRDELGLSVVRPVPPPRPAGPKGR